MVVLIFLLVMTCEIDKRLLTITFLWGGSICMDGENESLEAEQMMNFEKQRDLLFT